MSRQTGSYIRADEGPWRTTECEACYFLLDAAHDRLQKLVDDGLNSAAGYQRFAVTVDAVAMTFQTFKNMHIVPQGSQSPILNYLETAFFVMVSDSQDAGKIRIWAPYMYCSDPMATVSGREVYGFPKEFSSITINDKFFATHASGLANTGAMQRELASLLIVTGGVLNPYIEYLPNQLLQPVNLTQVRQERMMEGVGGFWPALGGFSSDLGQWVNLLIDPVIPFVFNRSQYDPRNSAWRSQLMQAASPVNQFSFQKFVIPLEFFVTDTRSHPVVSQLGLVTVAGDLKKIQPLFGCKLMLDFSLNSPQVL